MCSVIRAVLVSLTFASIPILVAILQSLHLWMDYIVYDVFYPNFQDGETYDFIVGKSFFHAYIKLSLGMLLIARSSLPIGEIEKY